MRGKIDGLQAENAASEKECAVLAATVEKLGMHIKKLPGRQKKDSSSSSKPPSTDVFRKPRPQNLREKSGKKPRGQFGHPGHARPERDMRKFKNKAKGSGCFRSAEGAQIYGECPANCVNGIIQQ